MNVTGVRWGKRFPRRERNGDRIEMDSGSALPEDQGSGEIMKQEIVVQKIARTKRK